MRRSGYRKLRNLPDVDYRERTEESVDELFNITSDESALSESENDEQESLRPAAAVDNVNASTPFRLAPPQLLLPDLSLNHAQEQTVLPYETEETASSLHSIDSTHEDFQSVGTDIDQVFQIAAVHDSSLESHTQTKTLLPEHSPAALDEAIHKNLTALVPQNIVSSDELNLFDPVMTEMAALELRKTAAQLESVMFQINELHESVEDIETFTKKEIVEMYDELKELRVQMHNLNSQIKLANDPNYDYEAEVAQLLTTSKNYLKHLKRKVSSFNA